MSVSIGLCLVLAGTALAFPDGSFESGGMAGFAAYGDVMVRDEATDPTKFGPAADGDHHLLLTTLPNGGGLGPLGNQGPYSGTNAMTIVMLETALAIDVGHISTLSQNGNPATEGSAVSRNVTLALGETISFEYNFLTNEPQPTNTYTDFFFWMLVRDGETTPFISERLADTSAGTAFVASLADDLAWETGYTTKSYTVTSPGDYRLIFGTVSVQDTNYASAALVDSVAAPEPSTGLMVAIGLVGFAGIRKRERRLRRRATA